MNMNDEKKEGTASDKKEYKNTLCLPTTSFPMKANLVQREPEILSFWEKNSIYKKVLAYNEGNKKFILHDGPPYANGHIHLGTALNKILKDIIVKSRSLQGYYTPFVPGWDCHGLPIELQVEQSLKEKNKNNISPLTLRKICREHATKFIGIQKKEFQRLGVFADWEQIYTTMKPQYESAIVSMTAQLVERGSILQSKKPIYWCCSCKTALAEAEVEYHSHKSTAIYIAFPIESSPIPLSIPLYAVIWTTTPWTIPSNQAIALNPDFEYVVIEHEKKGYIIARELVEKVASLFGFTQYSIVWEGLGNALEGTKALHPLYKRPSPFVFARYVTLDAGTGLVHTAPGHGREDYETGVHYNLPIYSPLDDAGIYTQDVEYFAGKSIIEGNMLVVDKLQEQEALLYKEVIEHSYPHCWRCRNAVIFRATKQWFISLEHNDLRKKALNDIQHNVQWIPAWGENRIYSMVEARPDWCISRQRIWGVPIIALHCSECHATYNEPEFIHRIAEAVALHQTGSDIWYELSAEEIRERYYPHLQCTCGSTTFTKEMDILDVWFDSACSCYAVLQSPEYPLGYPADLYLEGSDQHRGWFHSSLLLSEAVFDKAPYSSVMTHGYVVDGKGYKMSKSVGNVIAPEEIIARYGVEIVRLWVASVDYREDIRISDEIIARLLEAYRRIRNTCRFMLGNLFDFTQDDCIPYEELDALDRYALATMYDAHKKIQEAYTACEFHKCYQILYGMCITELSALYFDIIKERLYLSGKESKDRRSAQTALYHILRMVVCDMSPILSFTAEEIWQHIKNSIDVTVKESVFLQHVDDIEEYLLSDEEKELWSRLLSIRSLLTKALEPLRSQGVIGHSFDVDVVVYCEQPEQYEQLATELRIFFIVSSIVFKPYSEKPHDAQEIENGIAFVITPARGVKCERCWVYSTECGTHDEHPSLCVRCTSVVVANDT